MVEWKPICKYRGRYLVSNDGQVKSLFHDKRPREKILKPGKRGKNGLMYEFVVLTDGNGNIGYESVHRLVAEAFLENKDNLPEVNHKDRNTLNNHVDNLECRRLYSS